MVPSPSQHQSSPRAHLWLVLALAAGLVACRQEQVARYRAPKEAPPAPMASPHEHGEHDGHDHEGHEHEAAPATGEALPPPPKPEGRGGLKWTLPKGWSEQPGEGMRFATLKAPVPGEVEGTVVVLAGAAGGELANVNRWRGQIGLGPIEAGALAAARKAMKTKAGEVAVFDFSNEANKSRMVAGLLSTADGNTWFLKLSGDDAPVGKAKPDFLKLIESVRLD